MVLTDEQCTLRVARREDARRIWEIRNHPVVRERAGSQAAIAFEHHEAWFDRTYFSGLPHRCFVLVHGEQVIGYSRLDHDAARACHVVSIALDPAHTGRGLGTRLLQESLRQCADLATVHATVRRDNAASRRMFEKCGFVMAGGDDTNWLLVRSV